MIQKISRKNLDVFKYDRCVTESKQYRIYANSWYLDTVAQTWDVLVLDDYKAVMPIPWRIKFGIKYLYQPFFCQQLGVFSSDEITTDVLQRFLNKIPFFWWERSYHFNAGNLFQTENITVRRNFIVNLNKNFHQILKGTSNNRQRDYKKALRSNLIFQEIPSSEFFSFIKKTKTSFTISDNQLHLLKKISELKASILYGVKFQNELIAVSLILKDKHRITYLFPLHNKFSKSVGGATFLVFSLFQKYEKTNLIFDFEGSMIEGVAKFYRSFNALEEEYYAIS